MALVTTIGSATADSYATVAETDTFAEQNGYADWVDLDDEEQKEPALRKAARWLDGKYRGQIKGRKTEATQARAFPRVGCSDEDGNLFDDDVIPLVWKQAQMEAAIIESQNPGTLGPVNERETASEKVGPIAITYVAGATQESDLTAVTDLVSGLLASGGSATYGFLSRA